MDNSHRDWKIYPRRTLKSGGAIKNYWTEGSLKKWIAGKSLEKYGPKYPKIYLDFVTLVLPELVLFLSEK